MTSIPELHRVMDRLEAIHANTLSETGDRTGLAMHRLSLGIPNDDDLDTLLEDGAWFLDEAISQTATNSRDRDEQLDEAPAFRLAADVVTARSARDRQHAFRALGDLAGKGRLQTSRGSVRASLDQVGLARLLLRHVARGLARTTALRASDARSTGH